MNPILHSWIERGVIVPSPDQVWISGEVPEDAVEAGTILYPGTRLQGEALSIGPHCQIGSETPATLRNCQLGERVSLKGGFFDGAVFLDGSDAGSGAHIRPGTILEEEASLAHTVGLKQSIFLPFCVAGSLINFCDVLMAGGTSRRNHSEIGSSYIHFNFTPRGDKATPSLVGDVPHGVMLDQDPIFLGGQGGMVGPVKIAYGTIIAAGGIVRRDVLEPGKLIQTGGSRASQQDFDRTTYGPISRIIARNLEYLGNLVALRIWYRDIRSRFLRGARWKEALFTGLGTNLESVYQERRKRLKDLQERVFRSVEGLAPEDNTGGVLNEHRRFVEGFPAMEAALDERAKISGNSHSWKAFLEAFPGDGASYIETIQSMEPALRKEGTAGLQSIVDMHTRLWNTERFGKDTA